MREKVDNNRTLQKQRKNREDLPYVLYYTFVKCFCHIFFFVRHRTLQKQKKKRSSFPICFESHFSSLYRTNLLGNRHIIWLLDEFLNAISLKWNNIFYIRLYAICTAEM